MRNDLSNEMSDFFLNDIDGQHIANQWARNEDITLGQFQDVADTVIPVMATAIQTDTDKADNIFDIFDHQKSNPKSLLNRETGFDQSVANQEGVNILQVLFGNKENSRQVAQLASKKTGVSDTAIKRLLPVIATIATRMISGQMENQAGLKGKALKGQGNQINNVLVQFLDVNKDGSIVDDVIRMATDLFSKKGN